MLLNRILYQLYLLFVLLSKIMFLKPRHNIYNLFIDTIIDHIAVYLLHIYHIILFANHFKHLYYKIQFTVIKSLQIGLY